MKKRIKMLWAFFFLTLAIPVILGSRKNITYQFCGFILPFFCVTKILIIRRDNSVFCALNKNKLKPHLLVPYLFPTPLFFFFKKPDAPILHGKVDFCVNYKDKFQLDIYEPTKEVYQKRPVLIYYHGRAWVGGNKITSILNENINRNNYFVVTIKTCNYEKCTYLGL